MYFVVGEKTLFSRIALILICCAVLLCVASAGFAQETQFPRPAPGVSHARVATSVTHLAPAGSTTPRKRPARIQAQRTEVLPPPSLQVADPAKVTLRDGKLTVEANNSNLSQILRDMANISGMTIKGLDKGPRIFGVYGPGNSRDVLTDLLVGSGYNFIMVGSAHEGTPRELILTAQSVDAAAIAPVHPTAVPSADRDTPEQTESETNPSAPSTLGPGAISPAPSQNDLDDATRMQQTLKRIQQEQKQNAPQ